jgi:hypothetical protein
MASVRNIANGGAPSWYSSYMTAITGYVFAGAEWGKSVGFVDVILGLWGCSFLSEFCFLLAVAVVHQ